VALLPPLSPWSGRAPAFLLWGLLVYVADVALTVRREARSPTSAVTDHVPVIDAPIPPRAPEREAEVAPSLLEESPTESVTVEELKQHVACVTEALRSLNKMSALAQCGLIGRIPHLLAAARAEEADGPLPEAGPLETGRALREVLVEAIDRFKPAAPSNDASSSQSLQYAVLHEEYVLEWSIKQITLRHSISEATLFRNRSAAVRLLALDLMRREATLAARDR